MLNFLLAFIPRAIVQGIPLLFGSTGEIVTEKSGNLNLGIPGVMYVGAICGVIGSFFYEHSVPDASAMNGTLAILIPMACCMLGSLLMGILYCFLTVTLRANQNVTGLAMTTFGVGFGNFFGGSLIKLVDSDVPSITLTATSGFFSKTLPFAGKLGWFGKLFLSYGFLAYLAVIIAPPLVKRPTLFIVCSPLFFGFILIIPYEKTFHKKCITKKLPSYLRSPLYLFKSVHPALNCRPVRYLYS